jgi:hypothetical protein
LKLAGVVSGAALLIACHRPPVDVGPSPAPGQTLTGLATPPLRVVARATNGGPLAGLRMRLIGLRMGPTFAADANGVAQLGRSDVCSSSSSVHLDIIAFGYLFPDIYRVPCTTAANPPEHLVEVKGQPVIRLEDGVPAETTLSNDDHDWVYASDPDDYPCGPCKMAILTLPTGHAELKVEWTGVIPLRLWISNADDYDFTTRLADLGPAPGTNAIALTIPPEWRGSLVILKVGLPYGSRAGASLPSPISLRLTLLR